MDVAEQLRHYAAGEQRDRSPDLALGLVRSMQRPPVAGGGNPWHQLARERRHDMEHLRQPAEAKELCDTQEVERQVQAARSGQHLCQQEASPARAS